MTIPRKIYWVVTAIATVAAVSYAHVQSLTSVRLRVAATYLARDDQERAISVYRQIMRKESLGSKYRTLDTATFSDIHFVLAGLLFKERKMNEALDIFNRLAQINPAYNRQFPPGILNTPGDYKKSAFCLVRAGLITMAKDIFRKYLDQQDNDDRGHYQFGLLNEKTGDLTIAEAHYTKAVSLLTASSVDPGYLGSVYFHLGRIAEKTGDQGAAVNYYELAVQHQGARYLAYESLKRLYGQQARSQEAVGIQLIIDTLQPDYALHYQFEGSVNLSGYCLDEPEFELFNEGTMVFFWDKQGMRIVTSDLVKNISSDFGFEIDFPITGYPYGWDTDYYDAPESCHRVSVDSRQGTQTQHLVLDNATANFTSCQSFLVPLEPGYYLQATWVKSLNGSGFLGRREYDENRAAFSYSYAKKDIIDGEWKVYEEIFSVQPPLAYCKLALSNSQSKGLVYFDNVLLVRIEVPH